MLRERKITAMESSGGGDPRIWKAIHELKASIAGANGSESDSDPDTVLEESEDKQVSMCFNILATKFILVDTL